MRKKTKRELRAEIKNKDQLIQYLGDNQETELPFVESAWINAIEKRENDPSKSVVEWYFKFMGLKQYRSIGIATRNENENAKVSLNKVQDNILNTYFSDENTEFSDEIITWINMFNDLERNYLKRRYAEYCDNYDINSGADKITLKRILSIEIELFRIDMNRTTKGKIDSKVEKTYSDTLISLLESNKWTKKQRNSRDDMAQNRFTVWMDGQVKEGGFIIPKKTYPKDEVDFLLDTYINSMREMLS